MLRCGALGVDEGLRQTQADSEAIWEIWKAGAKATRPVRTHQCDEDGGHLGTRWLSARGRAYQRESSSEAVVPPRSAASAIPKPRPYGFNEA